VFDNPVKLLTSLNPDFFKGTAVENEVAKFLRGQATPGIAHRQAAGR
jgi:hypothetical protein